MFILLINKIFSRLCFGLYHYDWLVENGFTRGDDRVKYKAAREKTSGLLDMGFINGEHRLTEVGYKLLQITDNNGF